MTCTNKQCIECKHTKLRYVRAGTWGYRLLAYCDYDPKQKKACKRWEKK